MKNSTGQESINISVDGIISLIKFGLENINLFATDASRVNLKGVSIVNGGDTLLIEFYPRHSKAFDIKNEIGFIMAFLNGLLKDDLYEGIDLKMYGVKAYDSTDVELMYAINTKAAAAAIANGNSIEWLKTTLFQENSPDYRLSRAKTMISEIENGLRLTIREAYEKRWGLGWWDQIVETKISNVVKNTYQNKFGATTSDGNMLINYTFTLDLKKIISADWGTFRHLFANKISFESIMVELNLIRREEAHNRDITEVHLVDLERIYNFLLGEIALLYPNVTVNYLVENWRLKIKEIFSRPIGCTYSMAEFNTNDLEGQTQLIVVDCEAQIAYLKQLLANLNLLSPPVAKRKKHKELMSLLAGLLQLHELKLKKIQDSAFDSIQDIITSIRLQETKMDAFSRDFLLHES